MHARLSQLARPFALAFGTYILLNLALALERPELGTTEIWLQVRLVEPTLSLFASILGVALLVPHAAAARRWVRGVLTGTFAVFFSLSVDHTAAFYERWVRGAVLTCVPFPLSALLAVLLLTEILRVLFWRPVAAQTPPPARVFLGVLHVAAAFFVLTLAHIFTFGHIDHRRPADAAVILGAKVYADGRPCAALIDRLDTGVELYAAGLVKHLIMSGAVDPNGQSEPLAMKAYAIGRGVPADRILLDEGGVNTWASAVGTGKLLAARGWRTLLAVTQYFHCARVKLIFDREGTTVHTVPTCSTSPTWRTVPSRLSREGFFLLREAVAFPFYMVYYR